MLLPWNDWQFWTVTLVAAWGGWIVVKQFLPRRDNSPACGTCASGAAACAKPVSSERAESKLVVLGDRRS